MGKEAGDKFTVMRLDGSDKPNDESAALTRLAAFAYDLVRKAGHGETGHALGDIALHLDGARLQPKVSHCRNRRDPATPVRILKCLMAKSWLCLEAQR